MYRIISPKRGFFAKETKRRLCRRHLLTRSVSGRPGRGCRGAAVTFTKVTKEALWECLCFSENLERVLFGSRKVNKRNVLCSFCFCKKNQKGVFLLLFASAKSNPKQTEGCGPLDSRGTVQSSTQACFFIEIAVFRA